VHYEHFQHREIHKYTWYRDLLGQLLLIDFCIISADLLDVYGKRGADMSIDDLLGCESPHALDQDSAASDQAGMKIAIKRLRCYDSPEIQVSVCCK